MSRPSNSIVQIWLLVLTLIFASCTAESTSTLTSPVLISSPSITPINILRTPSLSPTYTATPQLPTHTPTTTSTVTLTPSPTSTPTLTPLPVQIIDEFGIPMVLVPAGTFTMGSNGKSFLERPAHSVTLNNYYIDQYEVANKWYAEFLNELGNQFEGLANWIEAKDPDLRVHQVDGIWIVEPGYEDYPMNEMTWYGARAFCQWRGARLPTEAEWEKAARGTDERTYPWGEGITCQQANYAGCFYESLPIDSYPESVSPYGAYNMAGNMMEWVADWYDKDYYADSPGENPTGPETGDFRIIRGSSWINSPEKLRTTYRFPKLPVLTYTSLGFRCVTDVSK